MTSLESRIALLEAQLRAILMRLEVLSSEIPTAEILSPPPLKRQHVEDLSDYVDVSVDEAATTLLQLRDAMVGSTHYVGEIVPAIHQNTGEMTMFVVANLRPARCGIYAYRLRVVDNSTGDLNSTFIRVQKEPICLQRRFYAYPERSFPVSTSTIDGREFFRSTDILKGWFWQYGMKNYTTPGEGEGFYGYRNIRMDVEKLRWVYNDGRGRFGSPLPGV